MSNLLKETIKEIVKAPFRRFDVKNLPAPLRTVEAIDMSSDDNFATIADRVDAVTADLLKILAMKGYEEITEIKESYWSYLGCSDRPERYFSKGNKLVLIGQSACLNPYKKIALKFNDVCALIIEDRDVKKRIYELETEKSVNKLLLLI